MYGDKHISQDGGHSWRPIFLQEMSSYSLLAFSENAHTMVSRGGSELFFSSDAGLHWHREPRRRGTSAIALSADGLKIAGINLSSTLRIVRHATPVLEYQAPPTAHGQDQTTFAVVDTGPAYFRNDGNESADHTFTVNIVSHFQVWAQEHGLPTDATAADGQNLLRYAFGQESDGSDASQVIALNGNAINRGGPALLGDPSTGPLRMLFGRRKNSGLTYRLEFSADLTGWHLDFTAPTVLADDGTVEACAVEFPAQLPPGQPPRFARLRVIH